MYPSYYFYGAAYKIRNERALKKEKKGRSRKPATWFKIVMPTYKVVLCEGKGESLNFLIFSVL